MRLFGCAEKYTLRTAHSAVFPISWHWNENNLFSISFNVFNIFDLIFQTNKHETNNAMCLILTKNKLRMNYNFNKAIIIYAQQWSGVPHPLRVSVSCFLKIFVLLFENICHIFFKYLITCFFKNIFRCASISWTSSVSAFCQQYVNIVVKIAVKIVSNFQ